MLSKRIAVKIGMLANAFQRYENARPPLEYLNEVEENVVWAGARLLEKSPAVVKNYTTSAITKWEVELGGKSTNALGRQYVFTKNVEVVAVIDDGVWTQHPDLDGCQWINNDEIQGNGKDDDNNGYIDDYYGWNFIDNNHDLITKGSHGTAVAGIIAAQDNYIGIVGIAPKAKIMPLIVCDDYGCTDQAIYDAIIYATKNGADVINLSLGSSNGYIGYSEDLNVAIKYAYNNNVVIVAAAGNGDIESDSQTGMDLDFYNISPVNNDAYGYFTVLGVGALEKTANYRTNWSNYGDGVEIYAPGENITSTVVPMYEDGYGYSQYNTGTSFSTPMVSAVAALLKSYSTFSNKEIINRIINKSNDGRLDIKNSLLGITDKNRRSESDDITEKIIVEIPDTANTEPTLEEEIVDDNKVVEENFDIFILNEKKLVKEVDKSLCERLNGNILLQVEQHGEGWYVYPDDLKKYFLGRPADAFNIMKKLGLGISENNFNSFNDYAPKGLSGKILLRVEANGEAYYVCPEDLKMHYLGRPVDALNIMRNLGLGITNNDIRKIDVGEI